MVVVPTFGGSWTEEKLDRLRRYLEAYTRIFTRNPNASTLKRIFVDAFAGTGLRTDGSDASHGLQSQLFGPDPDVQEFSKGSAQVALEIKPPFHQYIFIEKDPLFARELGVLCESFPGLRGRIVVRNDEANGFLTNWAKSTSWDGKRAVVFLDPYGMQVEWSTLEALAHTKAIDLWILFPLGQGVNRLLTRGSPPSGPWADRLTQIFGTDTWREEFYQPSSQRHLFEEDDHLEKTADFGRIGDFFRERLATVFAGVARNPLVLMNSRNCPIFQLFFAAANPRGAPTAVRIAESLLRKLR